jgi:hypothetical protein
MSVCYHRGVREQWYLYRKYLKLTPARFSLCFQRKRPRRFRRGLVECGSDCITFISKEKAPTLAKPGRHLGHPQSREVDNHPGRAGSGDRGRTSSEEVAMRQRIPFNKNVLEPTSEGVYCAERSHALRLDLRTGLFPERSLLYFLYFHSLWCDESDRQVSLLATLPRVKGCRHESRI